MKPTPPELLRRQQSWHSGRVKPARSLNCFFLALFLLSGLLAAIVSPASAGQEQTHRQQTMPEAAMTAGMPCCPTDPAETPDCGADCSTMRLCQAGCLANGPPKAFSLVVRPITSSPGPARNDLTSAWRPFEPPARPPRTCEIAGA